jgi:hypothetical protein
VRTTGSTGSGGALRERAAVAIVAAVLALGGGLAGCEKSDSGRAQSAREATLATGETTGVAGIGIDTAGVGVESVERAVQAPDTSSAAAIATLPPAAPRISREGGFAIIWPSGCERLRTRIPSGGPAPEDFPGTEPTEIEVSCWHGSRRDEIVQVNGYFNEMTDRGTPPDPPHVVAKVQQLLGDFGVTIMDQSPIRRGMLQGVDVKARREGDDPGELWLRGILAGPNYYILDVWNASGHVFENLEYQRFFGSFRVLAAEP